MKRVLCAVGLVAAIAAFSGCAGGIGETIVATRNHQGDLALEYKNYTDAATAYKLALQLSPDDAHARAGLADVQLRIADELYQNSKFDEALAALAVAAKYDPESVRLAALRSEIDDARLRREIVVSNYPTYRETAIAIRRSYQQLNTQNYEVVAAIQRFDYTFDSAQLAKAIRNSYELNQEVTRLTQRLISFRQLVESGATPAGTAETPATSAASLLPLP
jgi:tetratricopeptide (TPR) repeat protein